jgi:hypothetical protein
MSASSQLSCIDFVNGGNNDEAAAVAGVSLADGDDDATDGVTQMNNEGR